MSALLTLTLAVCLPSPVAAQEGSGAAPRVVEHVVAPDPVEPGEQTWQSLVVAAPAGTRLTVADQGAPDPVVERTGVWRTLRRPGAEGAVVWTFRAPMAVWAPGDWSAPRVLVKVFPPGRPSSAMRLPGPPVHARSPLPDGVRTLGIAGAEAPVFRGGAWMDLLAVVPLLILAGSGAVWWRAGRTRAPGQGRTVRPETAPTLAEVVSESRVDPGRAAILLARAVRLHPAVRSRGIADHHTTEEVVARLAGAEGLRDATARALSLADAVKFAGVEVSESMVVEAASVAAEAVGHG